MEGIIIRQCILYKCIFYIQRNVEVMALVVTFCTQSFLINDVAIAESDNLVFIG